MSQRNVETVIGRLATDEALRSRFAADPEALLRELLATGVELNGCEVRALATIEPRAVERFAEAIDPRLQKTYSCGGLQ
jgi:hypothetical protein